MIEIKNNEVTSTDGRLIHRLGTDIYFRRSTALPSDTEADFEEVDRAPAYTTDEYEARVSELIRRRYTLDAELAILRQRDSKPDEFADYNTFADECKSRARAELGGELGGERGGEAS